MKASAGQKRPSSLDKRSETARLVFSRLKPAYEGQPEAFSLGRRGQRNHRHRG